jgi:hypothetical protein
MRDPSQSGSGWQTQDSTSCGVCGGDGRLDNAFGQVGRCPSCHGSGRRGDDLGFRDVTKTKPSHHQATNRAKVVEKPTWPSTTDGIVLATEIRDASHLSADAKAKLTREIMDHEAAHALCTQTFIKKMRKLVRPQAPR